MEKMKAMWLTFLHWPGWTAWLKWSGWKAIGSWPGWKKLLYPHPAAVTVLTLVGAAGLFWAFFTGYETSIVAYLLYCVSFYALVTLCALLVKWIPRVKDKIEKDPLARKIREKEAAEGAFGIGLYVEQFINYVYGIFKIISGVLQGSAWIGADGIYNFAQGVIQLYQILRHKKVTDSLGQWKAYRQCGFMMIFLNLTMTGMMFQMIHMGRHENSSEIMIIATAAFTFYKLINCFITVAKDRRHEHPVESAVHFLDFSQALYNLFVLQVGLLWVYGGSDFPYQKLMNSLTGGAVCLLVCGMGVYMVWRANRDMRKLEETGNG